MNVQWDDLPDETRALARHDAPVLAQHVELTSKRRADNRRMSTSAMHDQTLCAWRATSDRLVVATAVRPYDNGRDGGPEGPWKHSALMSVPVLGAPERRVGIVDTDDDALPAWSFGYRFRPAWAAEVEDCWAFLPAKVRSEAEARVPQPSFWRCAMDWVLDAGFPVQQTITAVRLTSDRAVVVRATRGVEPVPGATSTQLLLHLTATPWQVEQMSFGLRGFGRPDPSAALEHGWELDGWGAPSAFGDELWRAAGSIPPFDPTPDADDPDVPLDPFRSGPRVLPSSVRQTELDLPGHLPPVDDRLEAARAWNEVLRDVLHNGREMQWVEECTSTYTRSQTWIWTWQAKLWNPLTGVWTTVEHDGHRVKPFPAGRWVVPGYGYGREAVAASADAPVLWHQLFTEVHREHRRGR